jgi:hypothetical protein
MQLQQPLTINVSFSSLHFYSIVVIRTQCNKIFPHYYLQRPHLADQGRKSA